MARVLIVDDQEDARETLAELLQYAGHEVATAANGCEALRYLRAHSRPQLILLDLMMPVMNGWEFRQQQLADALLADIPVAIVSGADRVEQREAAFGAVTFFVKPVDVDTLLETVAGYA
jgi:CheY-like chemotaxis protein